MARKRKPIGKIIFYRATVSVFFAIFIVVFLVWQKAHSSAPLLANYYLGTLPTDADSIKKLSKNDLLILSPEQAIVRKNVISQIKKDNPNIILLAYVPSQSYNMAWQQYPANTLFGDFQVKNNWWLRDDEGNVVSNWPGLKNTNMSLEWTDYLVNFVKTKILSAGVWDGIFWDMVNDGISGTNKGDIDLNGDGQKDTARLADVEWVNRIDYLLERSQELNVKYIIMNGSSIPSMQEYVNGRMYENFPTPWEKGGSWSGIMNGLEVNQQSNKQPLIYVINANTGNTGKSDNYRRMRFGLASSLMVNNVYFSFDHGDENHAQIWWYDEYDVNLGEPIGEAQSVSGSANFTEDVWRRDYTNGVAIVNVTTKSQTVDLGGEYEKITGKQDPAVNDGSITNAVTLGAKDGLVMLKTFQTLQGVTYPNGYFLSFYDINGNRVRNGFFSYDEEAQGAAKIFAGDLDGQGRVEKITAEGFKLKINDSNGGIWYEDFPFGGNYKGALDFAPGKLNGATENSLVVSGNSGGKVQLYTYYGANLIDNVYPLGKKYQGGFSAAIGNVDGTGKGNIVLGTGTGVQAQILIYDSNLKKVKKSFYIENKNYKKGIKIAVGDINGDGKDEVVAVLSSASGSLVRTFNFTGKKLSEFKIAQGFAGAQVSVGALDVNFDGRAEVILMNGQ
ncbi:MAG: putative glycoside hydrolase [Patescibacteria group bacterium]